MKRKRSIQDRQDTLHTVHGCGLLNAKLQQIRHPKCRTTFVKDSSLFSTIIEYRIVLSLEITIFKELLRNQNKITR